jgi:dTDP-4-amino-4,6-dideoxygalactose transaminase
MSRLYLSPPHLSGEEETLVAEAFRSNWIAPLGPMVDAFEREVCARVGVGHGAALSSGTAALHLAMLLLDIGAGREVLCPTLTFSATANAIAYTGARPVFIDCDRATWNMDPDLLEEELAARAKASRKPGAVIAVDLYGQCADYGRIEEICRAADVPLVEDSAEALGAACGEKQAGTFGRMAIFSFNGNKIVTTSGGGMLVSSDGELVRKARFLATQARDPAPHYQHSRIGYNYRMSNILAAIGRGQLRTLDERIVARRRNHEHYRATLSGLPGVEFMPVAPYGSPNYWLTVILIAPDAFGTDREGVRAALEAEDIEARPIWKPMHLQPVFAGCRVRGGAVSAGLFERGLCLPSGSQMTYNDLERVTGTIRSCCRTA